MSSEYSIKQKMISSAKQTMLYKACDSEGNTYTLKTNKLSNQSSDVNKLLYREFLLNSKCIHQNIVLAKEFSYVDGTPFIVKEYFDGDNLLDIALKLNNKNSILMQLSLGLQCVHKHEIIFNNFHPANFLVIDKIVKYIDFGSAFSIDSATPVSLSGEYSNHYISPEHSQKIDHNYSVQSDIYSLGCLFYHILSGEKIFSDTSEDQVIKKHLTWEPPMDNVAAAYHGIMLKMLAKSPIDRYESINEVIKDLNNINDEQTQSPKEYIVNRKEHQLYGRDLALLEVNKFIKNDRFNILLVKGVSGSGKSAFVLNTINKRLERSSVSKAVFAKFEQQYKSESYSSLRKIFLGILMHIQTLDVDALEKTVNEIHNKLGNNIGALVEFLPEIQSLIGIKSPAISLGPEGNHDRQYAVLSEFISIVAGYLDLYVVIDDMQWADASSIDLIRQIFLENKSQTIKNLSLVYRSDEITQNIEGFKLMKDISHSDDHNLEIDLDNLTNSDVRQWLSDVVMNIDEISLDDISSVVMNKTYGNPFYISLFIDELKRESLKNTTEKPFAELSQQILYLNSQRDIIRQRLSRICGITKDFINYAACFGSVFNGVKISEIIGIDRKSYEKIITELIAASLIVSFGNDSYQFGHDQIKEEVVINTSRQEEINFTIGTYLLKESDYACLDYLNKAHGCLGSTMKIDVIKLNMRAALHSKNIAAYSSSVEYLKQAFFLYKSTEKNILENAYQDSLYLEYIACLYLSKNVELGDKIFKEYFLYQTTNIARAGALMHQITFYKLLGKQKEAIFSGIAALRYLGIKTKIHPSMIQLIKESNNVKKLLRRKNPTSFLDPMPEDDVSNRMCIKIVNEIGISAYNLGYKALFGYIILKSVGLSVQHGCIPESAIGYMAFGMMIGYRKNDYDKSYQYGKIAIQINQMFKDEKNRGLVYYLYVIFILSWKVPAYETKAYLLEAQESAIKYYDNYSVINCSSRLISLFKDSDESLPVVVMEAEKYLNIMEGRCFDDGRALFQYFYNYLLCVSGETDNKYSFDTNDFNDKTTLNEMKKSNYTTGIALSFLLKSQVSFMYGDMLSFENHICRAEEYREGLKGFTYLIELDFYKGLLLVSKIERKYSKSDMKQLRKIVNELETCCDYSDDNFSVYKYIIGGEICRLEGDLITALRLYNQAIDSAINMKSIRHRALANEIAFKATVDDIPACAKNYINETFRLYSLWGAKHKAIELKAKYEEYIYQDPTDISQSLHAIEHFDLTTLISSSQAIAKERDLDKLVGVLLNLLIDNCGADRAVIIIKDKNNNYPICSIALRKKNRVNIEFISSSDNCVSENKHLSQDVVNYVINSESTKLVRDVSNDSLFMGCAYIKKHQPYSILCAPIKFQNEMIGAVYLERFDDLIVFNEQSLLMIGILASQAAIAIQNTSYINDLKQAELSIREKTDEVATLAKRMTVSDLASSIAHQIQQPLQAISHYSTGCYDMLKEKEDIPSTVASALKSISDQAHQAGVVINNLQGFFERGESNIIALSLFEVIHNSLNLIRHKIEQNNIVLSNDVFFKNDVMVNVDETQFSHVMINLISNAIDSLISSPNLDKKITITSRIIGDNVNIIVSDNGSGISDDIKPKLFQKFETTKKDGMGMGLSIARTFIETHGGSLSLSDSKEGAAFIIKMPVQLQEERSDESQ